jgi:hypothetical protein
MAKRKSKNSESEEKGRRKRGRGLGGLLVLIAIGAVAALVVSEPLRNKALDVLFGAEEEFEYTPPAHSAENSTVS